MTSYRLDETQQQAIFNEVHRRDNLRYPDGSKKPAPVDMKLEQLYYRANYSRSLDIRDGADALVVQGIWPPEMHSAVKAADEVRQRIYRGAPHDEYEAARFASIFQAERDAYMAISEYAEARAAGVAKLEAVNE